MSHDKTSMTEVERDTLDAVARHRQEYLESGGTKGHVRDFTFIGGYPFGPTLLIETIGRKSGVRRISPLCYGFIGGEAVVVASKGGADVNPAWYLNIQDMDDVVFQIATQAWRATWREPQGTEREKIWSYMVDVFPPYAGYQAATERQIPVVLLKAIEEVAVLEP